MLIILSLEPLAQFFYETDWVIWLKLRCVSQAEKKNDFFFFEILNFQKMLIFFTLNDPEVESLILGEKFYHFLKVQNSEKS